MFRVARIRSNHQVLWENETHGSSSYCRPILLFPAKETYGNCKFVADLQKERKDINFDIKVRENSVRVKVSASLCMLDGKLKSLLSGLGGAYCVMCTASRISGNDIDMIKCGFPIDRSIQQIKEICEKLQIYDDSEETFQIKKTKNDYHTRMVVTQYPISIEDIFFISPLHASLRNFDWLLKVVYHASAGHLSWSESRTSISNRTSRAMDFVNDYQEKIQKYVLSKTGILIDAPDSTGHGGSSNTGNVVKSILYTENRKLLTEFIESNQLREKVDKLLLNVAVILSVVYSNKSVNITEYASFCTQTALRAKEMLDSNGEPWISIPPTTHMLLAHSAQLIIDNGNKGLLIYTESGLEANHKYLRQFRQNNARKTSNFSNLTDCLKKLRIKSDPVIAKITKRNKCTFCRENDRTIRSCSKKRDTFSVATEYEHLLDVMLTSEN